MINANGIKKYYKDNNSIYKIIDNVSFSIEQGEMISLIGKTGAGKTTLLNLILGISKLDDGEIFFDNFSINKKSKNKDLRKITKTVLFSFQFPDYQFLHKTIREEFNFKDNDEKEILDLMNLLNLPISILDQSPFKISFGEKRKVILILLLILKPKVLLLDEPTSGLDTKTRKEFINLLLKINKQLDLTFILVSHDIESLKQINSRTFVLKDGKINDYKNINLALKEYSQNV